MCGITSVLNLHREKSLFLLSAPCLCFLFIIHVNFSFYDVEVWKHFRTHKIVLGSKTQIRKTEMSQEVVF